MSFFLPWRESVVSRDRQYRSKKTVRCLSPAVPAFKTSPGVADDLWSRLRRSKQYCDAYGVTVYHTLDLLALKTMCDHKQTHRDCAQHHRHSEVTQHSVASRVTCVTQVRTSLCAAVSRTYRQPPRPISMGLHCSHIGDALHRLQPSCDTH